MNLKVVRKTFTEESTIGELLVDGTFECYTLEDKVRAVKVWGRTAIPEGIYEVIVNFSQKFRRYMPLLLNVPNFDGIRIHSGNTAADTTGCILVGQARSRDSISQSRLAYNALFAKIQVAKRTEKIFIQIVGGNEEDVALGMVPSDAKAPSAARRARGAGKASAAKKGRRASRKASRKKGSK